MVIKAIGPINPLTLNGWMSLIGMPLLLILSLLFEQGQVESVRAAGWIGWGAVAYTAIIASLLAHTLWYRLIARYPVNRVVPYTLLNPVVGVASGISRSANRSAGIK